MTKVKKIELSNIPYGESIPDALYEIGSTRWLRIHRNNLTEVEAIQYEEDLKQMDENMIARKNYDASGMRALGAAICLDIVKEFREKIKTKSQMEMAKKKFGPILTSDMFTSYIGEMDLDEICGKIMKIPESYIRKIGRVEK